MNVRHSLTARGEGSGPTMIRRLAIMCTDEHQHEATTGSFRHGACRCPDGKLNHPRSWSKLAEPQSTLQPAHDVFRLVRREPQREYRWRPQSHTNWRRYRMQERQLSGSHHNDGRFTAA